MILQKTKAPGILKLGPFGAYNNVVWVFHHRGRAAIAEMPPFRQDQEPEPWLALKGVLHYWGLQLDYCLMSHAHLDHCQSLPQFREMFPDAKFVAHRSQSDSRLIHRLCAQIGRSPTDVFDEVYDGDIKLLDLGGEPMLLIHCPKHSLSDQFVIFRGTVMTGDWFLGDLKDCNALVKPSQKLRSIDRVEEWLDRTGYHISRAFSGHGDCLYYDLDFRAMLTKSKIDHPG